MIGLRFISVDLILEKLAAGDTKEELLDAYPNLTSDDIIACLLFAADSIKNEIAGNNKTIKKSNTNYRVTFFMILTGLRSIDVLQLKWSDLQEDEKGFKGKKIATNK